MVPEHGWRSLADRGSAPICRRRRSVRTHRREATVVQYVTHLGRVGPFPHGARLTYSVGISQCDVPAVPRLPGNWNEIRSQAVARSTTARPARSRVASGCRTRPTAIPRSALSPTSRACSHLRGSSRIGTPVLRPRLTSTDGIDTSTRQPVVRTSRLNLNYRLTFVVR